MRNIKIIKVIRIFIILIATLILSSCANKVKPYDIPVFNIRNEIYETVELKKQSVHDYVQFKLVLDTLSGTRFSFDYSQQEQCEIIIDESGTYVKENDVLAIKYSKELQNELRLKNENLELKQLYYNQLYEKYINSSQGYIDVLLAELDVQEAEYSVEKTLEKIEDLKVRAPKDGVIEKVVETYTNVTDEFGNVSKVFTVTYTYEIDNYVMRLNINNQDAVTSILNRIWEGEYPIIQIYDVNGVYYDTKVKDVSVSGFYNYRTASYDRALTVLLEFVKQEGVDYASVVKYALYYDQILKELDDAIVINTDCVYGGTDDLKYVYILVDGKKMTRYVTLGNEVYNSTSVIVLDGLSEGDLLITDITLEQ